MSRFQMAGRNEPKILRWVVDRWFLVFAFLLGVLVLAWVATSTLMVRGFPGS